MLEDTIRVMEDQDADPNADALDSNDDKSIAPRLLSPEEQSDSSLDTS